MEMVEEEQNQPKQVLSKRPRIEETLEKEEKDRISALPDCLIIQILSLLPSMEDAIRTELNLTFRDLACGAGFPLQEQFFINSCFIDLKLGGCVLNPNGAISWKMLRNLCLSDANLDEDLIENILSGSPILETLELHDCYGYNRLDIPSKSVKNLVFSGYSDPSNVFYAVDSIEIKAPNILSLKIRSDLILWKLLLLDVSSLVEAELDYTKIGYWELSWKESEEELLKGFIQSLHHVKELEVGNCCYEVLGRLEAKGFPFPSNMKFPVVISPSKRRRVGII